MCQVNNLFLFSFQVIRSAKKKHILSLQAEDRLAFIISFYLAAHLADCYDFYENLKKKKHTASNAGMIFISTIFIALLQPTLQESWWICSDVVAFVNKWPPTKTYALVIIGSKWNSNKM